MNSKLFEAGMIVGFRQLFVVLVLGLIVFLAVPLPPKNTEGVSLGDSDLRERSIDISLGSAIALADILLAMGLIATATTPIISTAQEIKRAARRHNPGKPLSVVDKLIALAGMAALGCAVLAFNGRQPNVASLENLALISVITSVARPGLASVGFAFFGAITRAASLSKKLG